MLDKNNFPGVKTRQRSVQTRSLGAAMLFARSPLSARQAMNESVAGLLEADYPARAIYTSEVSRGHTIHAIVDAAARQDSDRTVHASAGDTSAGDPRTASGQPLNHANS